MTIRRFSAGVCCLLLVAVAVGSTLSGCSGSGENKPRRLVILTNAVSPFWDAADVGSQNAAEDLKLEASGLRVVFDKNTKGTEGQIAKLRQYAGADDIAGVAISVTDPQNTTLIREMRKLREMGVKVITLDSDVDRSKNRDARFAYIGTDNIVAGRELGRCAKGLLPGGGKYAAFVGYKNQANAIERITGFQEGAGSKFEQAEFLGDEVDENRAYRNVKDAWDRHPDLNLFVGIWSYNTPAIIQFVTNQNIRDKVKVIGFDADPPAIKGMENGKVDALVVQNPYQMGYQSVRLLKALIEDDQQTIDDMYPNRSTDKKRGDVYDTGLKVVVPDGDTPLTKDMFDDSTQFLKLDEFQAWLKKYSLTGS